MMPRPFTHRNLRFIAQIAFPAFALIVASSGIAANSKAEARRELGFKSLGRAYKQLNDTLRTGSPDKVVVAAALKDIGAARRDIYTWFPADSAPPPGVETSTKPEIWTKPAAFKSKLDGFALQADILMKVGATGDKAALATEARKLGTTCKACHDMFRVKD